MMKEFMQTHRIFLTPISPIHIGCGEDFEPTNYVIDNQVLYHFEPSHLHLSTEQKNELLNKAYSARLLEIQRFFLKYKKEAVSFSHYFANVPQDIANKWENKIGKVVQNEKDRDVINQLAIERTAYLPYNHSAYIPGSSFKGALATAFLDDAHKNSHQRRTSSSNLNKELLKDYMGEFNESKFRTVKFGDFVPKHPVHSQVYYALNYKKVPTEKKGMDRGIALRRECILAGQYRAFESELSLWENEKNQSTIQHYFQILNQYHQPIFEKECERLVANRFVSQEWVRQIKALLANKNVALVRLGKNGADSKVYRDPKLTQIKIMKGKGKNEYKSESTTVWLAGMQEKQLSDLLPFGWAILELNQQGENMELKQWCDKQVKPSFNREAILTKRQELELVHQQQLAEQQAKQQALIEAEQAKQAMLNSLNETQKSVMDFVENVNNTRELQADTTGSTILKNLTSLVESAVSWNAKDKAFLLEQITLELIKSKVKFNKKDSEKNLKKLFNKLSVN
ncbi:RAMP superfamily CRISPR-associated protein [Pasteurella sp. P03HT]